MKLRDDDRGVGFFFIKGMAIIFITVLLWSVMNEPIQTVLSVAEDEVSENMSDTHGAATWAWTIWPIVIIVGAAIYMVYASQSAG